MISTPLRPAPTASVEVENLDDDACLYRPDIDEVVVLNRSAADIWRLADGSRTADEITDELAARYGGDPAAMRVDVQTVIDDLLDRGFLADAKYSIS
jgi:Coenzyme PQQ synthesis protein D (PqqD)